MNIISRLSLFLSIVSILATSNVGFVQATNAPNFPSCQNQTESGNWSSSASGTHHIPGQEEAIAGSDDVYYLEGGNFLQCLCKSDGIGGIQTYWWNIGESETQVQGWFNEFGGDWNLLQSNYLAQNSEYSCGDPEPSPTPTPVPTSTPRPENHSSECVLLTPSTFEGTAPLTIDFHANGHDTQGFVEEYEFNFGDSSGGQPQVVRQIYADAAHRYENPGEYGATLMVKDSKGVWKTSDACSVHIKVLSEPKVLGASNAKELPKTGASSILAASALGLGLIARGAYLRLKNS